MGRGESLFRYLSHVLRSPNDETTQFYKAVSQTNMTTNYDSTDKVPFVSLRPFILGNAIFHIYDKYSAAECSTCYSQLTNFNQRIEGRLKST